MGLQRQPGVVNYLLGSDPTKWRPGAPTYARAKFAGVYPGIDVVYYGAEVRGERQEARANGQGPATGVPSTMMSRRADTRTRPSLDGSQPTQIGCVSQTGSSSPGSCGRPLAALSSQLSALEYDFVVHPGADPRRIRIAFEGADGIRMAGGDLVVATPAGEVRLRRPVAYQTINGRRVEVACRYEALQSRAANRSPGARFAVARYDASRPLVLDPVLEYSTYLGGESYVTSIAVDAAGAAYLSGDTSVAAYPTTSGAYDTTYNGSQDVYVTKLSPNGSALVYSTFIGGDGTDHIGDIALDASGSVYMTGYTASSDFPTTAGAYDVTRSGTQSDAFVTKLNAAGSGLAYATFLGGTLGNVGAGIAVDGAGHAYVGGITWSTDFPTTAGAFDRTYNGGYSDIFVARLDPTGAALVYSTYVGGTGDENLYGIAIDASGAAYVSGDTNSADYPTTPGAYDTTYNGGNRDGVVTKLNDTGTALAYSTYIGGSGDDTNTAIGLDSAGAAYVAGETTSADFPTSPGAYCTTFGGGYYDAFAAKFAPDGSALAYATYLGGADMDQAYAIAVGAGGIAYIVGQTFSSGFPTTPDALRRSLSGTTDGFVTALNASGDALVYSTLLGGAEDDVCFAVATDAAEALYIGGATSSTAFPTTPSAYRTSLTGASDGFACKLVLRAATRTSTLDRSGTITELVTLRAYLNRVSDNAYLDGRTVQFSVDGTLVGSAVTGATGSPGRADLNWHISAGPASRPIVAAFQGDETYAPSSGSATLTCLSWATKMASFPRTARITDRTELKARLVRSDNVPLYNKTINFYVDGTFIIARPTNLEGYASYPYYTVPDGAGAGTRTILSEWPGNAGYAPVSKTATLTVLKAIPYIWVLRKTIPRGAIANLYAYFRRLYDYQRQTGKPVDFKLNGTVIQSVVTDDVAVARYLYRTTEPPGVYTIRCEFYGDAWLEPGYGEASLTIY